jgi:cytochrome bd ubiquinol oxidase subunit I
MLGFDAIELAGFQFALTGWYHLLLPAISIGLASYLAVQNGLLLWAGKDICLRRFHDWKTILAVALGVGLGVGLIWGIVLSSPVSPNWPALSDRAGPVIGPLMGDKVLPAYLSAALVLMLMLLSHSGYASWVFRGKTNPAGACR